MSNELLILKEADKALLERVKSLIEAAKREVAVTVNSAMTLLYWEIGAYVNSYILDNKRGEYGKQIVVSLIRQLTWTHIIALIPIEDELKRNFYIEMCRMEHWSVRTLRKKIDSMLYERTAISQKPEEMIQKELSLLQKEQLTPDIVFHDPYILDFLGLHDTYSEKDLEKARRRLANSISPAE